MGADGQIMTTCENSRKEDITMWAVNFTEADFYITGDEDAVTRTGQSCWPGELAFFPIGPMASPLAKNTAFNMLNAFAGIKGDSVKLY